MTCDTLLCYRLSACNCVCGNVILATYRVILIAEEKAVYERFPTALINRMEKHHVVMETVLHPRLYPLLKEFRQWIMDFAKIRTRYTVSPFIALFQLAYIFH